MAELYLHESLWHRILAASAPRTRCVAAAVSRAARDAAKAPALWRRLAFDSHAGLRAKDLLRLLERAKGVKGLELRLARGPAAVALENRARFAEAIHFNVPHPPRAAALAAALTGVVALALDERSSPVGGATDALARALARTGGAADLERLDLAFEPYSQAADLFTWRGVAALAGPRLRAVTLAGATAVCDRGLAALGSHCAALTDFEWRGYSELVSDSGLAALARRPRAALTRVVLDPRLPRVTDAGIAALAGACPRLAEITLPAGCTDAALAALAAAPCAATLTTVDASAARGVTAAGVAALRAACPRLERVVV